MTTTIGCGWRWLGLTLLLSACESSGAVARPDVIAGRTAAPDGVSIAYDSRGEGEVALVFVHGWACDRSFWFMQLDAFATDYRVVAIDLGGHGESGSERDDWSLATLADDVVAVVDALELPRVILVGHSMGGPVSLEAAPRLAGRVLGVIGVDTLHDAEQIYTEEMIEAQLAAFERDFEGMMVASVRGMFTANADPEIVDWTAEKAGGVEREVMLAIVRRFAGYDVGRAFQGANVPIRCINAAPRPPMRLVTKLETNLEYADYAVTLMDGVGHYPMLERAAPFNDCLRAWLEDLVPVAGG